MNYENSKIVVIINNKKFIICYSYNEKTTFQDLLEYIAFLFPPMKICECFSFYTFQNNNNYDSNYNKLHIPKSYLIFKYSEVLNELILEKKNKNCDHLGINYLNNSKEEIYSLFKKENDNLNKKVKENDKTIDNLRYQLKILEADLNKIKSENKELTKKLKKKDDNINDFNEKVKILSRDNKLLKAGINGDIQKIQMLENLGLEGGQIKPRENLIQIDPKTNEIIGEQSYKNPYLSDFYDVIVHVDSIKDINKGWKVEMTKKGEENYNNYKTQKVLKIGVIGNANKGKSFLLSKISKIKLPSGMSIKTEGLSIKYPDTTIFKQRNIVLLDSAGLETPVLASDDELKNDKENVFFREKSREKLITELFLQNYIIDNSDILIVVVDILSFAEQKLLLKIKEVRKKWKKQDNPLYIIHNLKTFTSVEQIKDYINNTLLKSATFNLEEGHKISTKIETKKGTYFNEVVKDKEKSQKIYHLIYANESSKEVKEFNEFTLGFIENSYQNVTNLEPYDVIESIKDIYITLSKDIVEKKESNDKVEKENFDNSDPYLIKLKDENEIILKKCLIDELGFSNLKANGFEPTYNIYKKDNKIKVRVEAPGNSTENIQTYIEKIGEYNMIKISGEKKRDKEPEKAEDNIYNTRENGKFFVDIPLKSQEYDLINEGIKVDVKKGVIMIEYNLAEKSKAIIYGNGEEDI